MALHQKIGYPQNPGVLIIFPMVQWPFLGIAHFQVDPNLKYHGYSYIYLTGGLEHVLFFHMLGIMILID